MRRAGVLLDTGPLVALLNRSDTHHDRAKALAASCEPPLRTCEAVLVEAAHLLSKIHRLAPVGLLDLGRVGALTIAMQVEAQWEALGRILEKYRDVPASVADACLIRCAELHEEPRILTFDADFRIYRWARNRRFDVIQ